MKIVTEINAKLSFFIQRWKEHKADSCHKDFNRKMHSNSSQHAAKSAHYFRFHPEKHTQDKKGNIQEGSRELWGRGKELFNTKSS